MREKTGDKFLNDLFGFLDHLINSGEEVHIIDKSDPDNVVEHVFNADEDDEIDIDEVLFSDDYEPPLWGIPDINRVLFNPPATIVFWGDGTKTVVKVREGDKFEKYAGFAMACMKKMFGSTGAAMEIMKEFDSTPEPKPKKEELKPKPQKSSFVSDKPMFSWDDIMKIVFGDNMPYKEEKKDEAPAE